MKKNEKLLGTQISSEFKLKLTILNQTASFGPRLGRAILKLLYGYSPPRLLSGF